MSTHDPTDDSLEPKARKACVNCRRQKMKCRLEGNETCRRCRQAGMQCVFVPRANAATNRGSPSSLSTAPNVSASVLQRLDYIETLLGIGKSVVDNERIENEEEKGEDSTQNENSYGSLRSAIDVLRTVASGCVDAAIWRHNTVKELWSRFDERMPGLHFMPGRLDFNSPCPLLLASMLYCSSVRGPADVCPLATQYFTVLCRALAQLSIPNSIIGKAPNAERQAENWAFQTILAIVLAGLLSEATTRETGIWISIAYRLILGHCPASTSERSGDWRKLFNGVQIVDLEHASIHLLCPVLPVTAPLAALQTSPGDQLARLSRIMHGGLSHFAGRGLPNIWSCFTQDTPLRGDSTLTFSASDAAVIRDWARQLDAWLVEFSGSVEDSQEDRVLVFRQYILHRLTVLSIYHPARGCDLRSQSLSAAESYELLLSARAALRLHANDDTIWSNWDLVMISWAALIVLQGLAGGLGELADIDLVKAHVAALEQFHETGGGVRQVLISRLRPRLEEIRVPDLMMQQRQRQQSNLHGLENTYDCSWQIFDQNSFQQMSTLGWGPDHQILALQ